MHSSRSSYQVINNTLLMNTFMNETKNIHYQKHSLVHTRAGGSNIRLFTIRGEGPIFQQKKPFTLRQKERSAKNSHHPRNIKKYKTII